MVDKVPGRPEGVHSDRPLQSRSRAGLGGTLGGLGLMAHLPQSEGSAPGEHAERLRSPSSSDTCTTGL